MGHPLNPLHIILVTVGLLTSSVFGYERAYPPTGAGSFEFKQLPEGRVIANAAASGGYFENANSLFGPLFRFISKKEIAMTTPVEASMEPGEMIFRIGSKDLAKAGDSSANILVRSVPVRLVASHGVRGSYTSENFSRAANALKRWVLQDPAYTADGPVSAAFWDGPFMPGPFKRFEVHLPVKTVPGSLNDLQGRHRIILYSTPDSALPALMTLIAENRESILERDLVFLRDTPVPWLPFHFELQKADRERWATQLETGSETSIFLLLGKDGGLKATQTGSLDLKAFFEKIDTMPMRRAEMQQGF